jgi:hypothetical protein
MENNKILHDYDNYRNALMDYSFTKYKKDTAVPGFGAKYEALRQFFAHERKAALTEKKED